MVVGAVVGRGDVCGISIVPQFAGRRDGATDSRGVSSETVRGGMSEIS